MRHGNAKALPLKSLNQLDDVLLQEDGEKENDSGVANVKPASPPPTVPSPVAPTSGGQDCEGGVCKLVRKKPATDPAPAPASGGQECEGGVCTLVRKKPTVASVPAASAVTAGSPGPTGNVMQCEGGVCKLVRKKTTPTVDGAAAASGGETRQGEVVAGDGTTAGKRDGDAAAAAVGESLGDGDVMPSLEVVCMDGGERKSLDDVTGGGPAVLGACFINYAFVHWKSTYTAVTWVLREPPCSQFRKHRCRCTRVARSLKLAYRFSTSRTSARRLFGSKCRRCWFVGVTC